MDQVMQFSVHGSVPSGACVFTLNVQVLLSSVYQRDAFWNLAFLSHRTSWTYWPDLPLSSWVMLRSSKLRWAAWGVGGPPATLLPCQLRGVAGSSLFHFQVFFWSVIVHEFVCLRIFLVFKNTRRKKIYIFGLFVLFLVGPVRFLLIILWPFLVLMAMFISWPRFEVTLALWLASSCTPVSGRDWTFGERARVSKIISQRQCQWTRMGGLTPLSCTSLGSSAVCGTWLLAFRDSPVTAAWSR